MRDKIVHMIALQSSLNVQINPEWRSAHYPWRRAIWMEAAELVEHIGWKWWKKNHASSDIQARLEVVDIFHFLLSHLIGCYESEEDLIGVLTEALGQANIEPSVMIQDKAVLIRAVESMVGLAARENCSDMSLLHSFVTVSHLVGLDGATLYRLYVAKNMLNRYRQENGYKDGSYQKMWNGQEDNQHLESIIQSLPDMHGSAFEYSVLAALDVVYSSHKLAA